MGALWVSYRSQPLCHKPRSLLLAATLLSGEATQRHPPGQFSTGEKKSIRWNTSHNTLGFSSIRIELYKETGGVFCLNLSGFCQTSFHCRWFSRNNFGQNALNFMFSSSILSVLKEPLRSREMVSWICHGGIMTPENPSSSWRRAVREKETAAVVSREI